MAPDDEAWAERLLKGLSEHQQEFVPAASPPPGSGEFPKIPRYIIRERLGEGVTSIVFAAEDPALHRRVAIKFLREAATWSPQARERFRREGQTAAALTHPNVVTVHDIGEDQGRLYLVMEFVDGKSLNDVIDTWRAAGEKKVVELIEKAARGVGAAHKRGIVHRDLKPANILVNASGEPKVGDFGLAHLLDSGAELTKTGTVLGTPLYMAPEQAAGRSKEITPRTDVYGLGAILYEALVGKPPHDGESIQELYGKILRDEAPAPRKLNPKVSPDLETIVLKALDKNPLRRYATADDLADDLKRWRTGEAILARPPSLIYRARRALARRKALAVSLAAAAIGALIVLAVAMPTIREGRRREEQTRHAIGLWGKVSPLLADGEKFVESGDTAGARRHLEDAIERCRKLIQDEDLPHAHYLLGRLLEAGGKRDAANEELALAARMDPRLDTSPFDRDLQERLARWPKDAEVLVDPAVSQFRARPERVWVAAPDGTAEGAGTAQSPLSLDRAVGPSTPVRPGQHLQLRGGSYRIPSNGLEFVLGGTPDQPVMIRPFGSEHPVIDLSKVPSRGRGVVVRGSDLWIVGLEFSESSTQRTGQDAVVTTGVALAGSRQKLVNCSFHDLRLLSISTSAPLPLDSEIYGTFFLNNGVPGEGGGPEWSYNISSTSLGRIQDFNDNVVAYTHSGQLLVSLEGGHGENSVFRARGNILQGPGRFLMLGRPGAYSQIDCSANLLYKSSLEYWVPESNASMKATVKDNVVMPGRFRGHFGGMTGEFSGNAFWDAEGKIVLDVTSFQEIRFDRNIYYSPFRTQWGAADGPAWQEWRTKNSADLNSRLVERGPTGTHVVVRPNRFERGRAHVAVYNWSRGDGVEVDLSNGLNRGDRFGVYRVEDLKGAPVASGTYDGRLVSLPLQKGQEFQIFLLRLLTAP